MAHGVATNHLLLLNGPRLHLKQTIQHVCFPEIYLIHLFGVIGQDVGHPNLAGVRQIR